MGKLAVSLGIAVVALLAGAVYFHWALGAPEMYAYSGYQGPFVTRIVLLANSGDSLGAPWFAWLTMWLVAVTGVMASALALAIALRTTMTPATRRLAASLALASLAGAYFFLVEAHPAYRIVLGLDGTGSVPLAGDAVAYLAGFVSPYLFVRFFIGFPRAPTEGEWRSHFTALFEAQHKSMRIGWRRHVYTRRAHVSRLVAVQIEGSVSMLLRLDSARPLAWIVPLALAAALIDASGRRELQAFVLPVGLTAIFLPMTLAFEALRYHHRHSVADDRAKVEWIYGTVFVGGIATSCVAPLWWLLLYVGIERFEAMGLGVVPGVMFAGPMITSYQLFVLAILVALALSIFYRGTVDPRLALGKLTLAGAVAFLLAFVFLLAERTVAYQLARWLALPPESGPLIAAALATATFAPMRARAEKAVNRLVLRYLPLDSLVEGRRVTLAIALSDLTGYTALSATDERQALLVAALLQRTAQLQCERHAGRVIKSMGDAVLVAFDDAAAAAKAIAALHDEFSRSARELGLPALPVHSGAHLGEVTVTADGDVYGQVVNIAARLQALAKPGEVVASREFAQAAGVAPASFQPLGAVRLKNVPDAVECVVMHRDESPPDQTELETVPVPA